MKACAHPFQMFLMLHPLQLSNCTIFILLLPQTNIPTVRLVGMPSQVFFFFPPLRAALLKMTVCIDIWALAPLALPPLICPDKGTKTCQMQGEELDYFFFLSWQKVKSSNFRHIEIWCSAQYSFWIKISFFSVCTEYLHSSFFDTKEPTPVPLGQQWAVWSCHRSERDCFPYRFLFFWR